MLDRAERPAVLAGSQVWHCRGAEALPAFAEGAGRAGLPQRLRPRVCCRPAIPSCSTARAARRLARPTSSLVIGTPFDFRLGYGSGWPPTRR